MKPIEAGCNAMTLTRAYVAVTEIEVGMMVCLNKNERIITPDLYDGNIINFVIGIAQNDASPGGVVYARTGMYEIEFERKFTEHEHLNSGVWAIDAWKIATWYPGDRKLWVGKIWSLGKKSLLVGVGL